MTLEGRSRINESFEHNKFALGHKTLSTDINLQTFTASVRFGSRKGLFVKKMQGETTGIFLIADNFIQNVANLVNHLIVLRFDTADSNLKLWARAKATRLGFNPIEPKEENSYRVTVIKTYFPNKS